MRRYLIALMLVATTCGAADDRIGDQTVYRDPQDREMVLAISQAQRTLDDFLALARNPPAGASSFKLKVMISDASGVEHFWFTPFKEIEGGFAGVLANEPDLVKSVTAGNVYAFKREQITDWGYVLNGKQVGSFTVCALFKTMNKDVVERYKRDYGFECGI